MRAPPGTHNGESNMHTIIDAIGGLAMLAVILTLAYALGA